MFTKTTQSEQHEVVDPRDASESPTLQRLAAIREAAKRSGQAAPQRDDNVVHLPVSQR